MSIQVSQLIEKVNNKPVIDDINVMLEECERLNAQLKPLKPKSSALLDQLSKQVKVLNAQKTELATTQKNQSWQLLFSIVEQSIEQNKETKFDPTFEQLPTKWKKRLLAVPSTSAESSTRLEKTIALEVIAGVKSPQVDQALTMKVQVELMQQQLSNKQTITLETLLDEWLALGQLSDTDLPLIARIRPLFVQKN